MSQAKSAARQLIEACVQETGKLHAELSEETIVLVEQAGALMTESIEAGGKILWFGNGGSATQSQHMAGEFVGRFQEERRSLSSISLTENMASVTAIANDYSFEDLFVRQLEGLGRAGDVAVGLSTSGNSPNVIRALERAKHMKIRTIGLTGRSGGAMAELAEICIRVPSTVTARIQEVHLTIGHILCALVEQSLSGK